MLLRSMTVDPDDLRRETGWEIKPEGACKGDVCVPPFPGRSCGPDVRPAGPGIVVEERGDMRQGDGMEPRVDLVTVRVTDLESATRYYVEGLGWQPLLAVPGEVTFFQIAHGQALSLFDAAGFDADLGGLAAASYTLSQNVATKAEVDAVVAGMVAAGGSVLKAPQRADWGGYHSLVADPSGICWEIAHNPGWSVGPDGTVALGPVTEAPDPASGA